MMFQVDHDRLWKFITPVVIVTSISLFQYYVISIYSIYHFTIVILKSIISSSPLIQNNHLSGAIMEILFHICYILAFISYYKSVVVDPGKIPNNLSKHLREGEPQQYESKFLQKKRSLRKIKTQKSLNQNANQFSPSNNFSPSHQPKSRGSFSRRNDGIYETNLMDFIQPVFSSKQKKIDPKNQSLPMQTLQNNSAIFFPSNENTDEIWQNLSDIDFTYCEICAQPKPPRAHHCRMCDRCILRMDHHCPWIGNCIGFENHKYFVLFLFYSLIYLFGSLLVFVPSVIDDIYHYRMMNSTYILLAYLAVSIPEFLFEITLIVVHLYTLTHNLTTIEIYRKRKQNPFDQQSWRKNLEQIFGCRISTWLLPIQPKNRTTDGVYYPLFFKESISEELLQESFIYP